MIHATSEYLEMFFGNLLPGAQHELKIAISMWSIKAKLRFKEPVLKFQSAKMALWIALWKSWLC